MTPSQTYEDLLAIAKSNPEATDFGELRLAYARSSHYDPHSPGSKIDRSLGEALREGNKQKAIEAINRLMKANYLDIHAHLAAASVYGTTGEEARAASHRTFGGRLLDSIFRSGDGRSYETAFVVISVAEEYAVLDALRLELTVQCRIDHEGHYFDRLELHHPQTGETCEMYFNIDLPHGWLLRQLEQNPSEMEKRFERLIELHPKVRKRKRGT